MNLTLTLDRDELQAVRQRLAKSGGSAARKVAAVSPDVPFPVTWDESGEIHQALRDSGLA